MNDELLGELVGTIIVITICVFLWINISNENDKDTSLLINNHEQLQCGHLETC